MQRPPSMHGIGLRSAHFGELLADGVDVDLVEAISENFAGRGGRPLAVLERVRRDCRVVLHGVSLSLGGLDPLDQRMLRDIRALRDRIEASWVSDHLCFGTALGHSGHDLWPLPWTQESLEHVVPRIRQAQDLLGDRIALENVSSYVQFAENEMSEWEFLCEVAARSDCDLLLDLNNVHVNATNHGFVGRDFVAALPSARIRQLHLSGHLDCGSHLFDNHGDAVAEPVWQLFRECVRLHGARPTIIEWDEHVPTLERLVAESRRAAAIEADVRSAA